MIKTLREDHLLVVVEMIVVRKRDCSLSEVMRNRTMIASVIQTVAYHAVRSGTGGITRESHGCGHAHPLIDEVSDDIIDLVVIILERLRAYFADGNSPSANEVVADRVAAAFRSLKAPDGS